MDRIQLIDKAWYSISLRNPYGGMDIYDKVFRMGAKWADEHPNWISTEEHPCPKDRQILVLADNGLITTGHWDAERERWCASTDLLPPTQSIRADILYWMELPKKPEGIPEFNPKEYMEDDDEFVQAKNSPWVLFKKQQPRANMEVLVSDGGSCIQTNTLTFLPDGSKDWEHHSPFKIKYWMRIPKI